MTCQTRKDMFMCVDAGAHTDALQIFKRYRWKETFGRNRNNQKEKNDTNNRMLEKVTK